MNEKERKQALLNHYEGKPIQRFLQIDATTLSSNLLGDSVVVPDADGDVIFTAVRDELQTSGWDIRIRIPEGTDLKHLGRLLHKVACYLKTCQPLKFDAPQDAVLGAGGGAFGRLTGDDDDEAERYPGWYD